MNDLVLSASELGDLRADCRARGLPDPGTICLTRAVRTWESTVPGQGMAIVRHLLDWYALGARFPFADTVLDADALAAPAWRRLKTHQVVGFDRLADAIDRVAPGRRLRELVLADADDAIAPLGGWLIDRLPALLWAELGTNLWLGVRAHLPDDASAAAFEWVMGGWCDCALADLAATLGGDPQRYAAVMQCWAAGNWPLGVDLDGALVVCRAGHGRGMFDSVAVAQRIGDRLGS